MLDIKRLKLKQFRVGLDLNQAEMARKCGIDRASYSLIEQGKRAGSAEFWYKLSKEFDLSPEDVWVMLYENKK